MVNMFGSLVVCLPSQFTGGSLVTRYQGQEIDYDWSSPTNDPVQNIQWAAFFSDVELEIFPIADGKSSLPKSMQPSIYPLGRRLTFSTSQVYTAQPTSVMIALPHI